MNNIYKYSSLIILILTINCVAQKENNEVLEITYNALTRGRSEMIIFKQNTLLHKNNINTKEYVLNNKDSKAISKAVWNINLSKIQSLKAPSEKRFFDGAMTTTISIKKGDKTYTSSSFDHDNPPKELKYLVDLLKSYLK